MQAGEYTAPEEKGDVDGLTVGHVDPFNMYELFLVIIKLEHAL